MKNKMKEDYSKKNPQHMREINEIKEVKRKLKKEIEAKEKELEKKEKESRSTIKELKDKVSSLESDKKDANKKLEKQESSQGKAEAENKKLSLKNEDLVLEVKALNKDLKDGEIKFQNELKNLEAKLKSLKAEYDNKDDLNKEVIADNEEKIKELKRNNEALEKQLKEVSQKQASIESEKNSMSKELEEKKKESSTNKTIILECKSEIENAKKLIKSSTKDISDRNNVIAELKKKLDACETSNSEKQREIEDMKLDLSKRTVSSDKFKEVTEKVKEKEYSLLKLRNQLFDKDTIISEKEEEVKKLSGRITEINKEHEKKMENRAFEEINNQNNLRHQLLSQQYEMKKTLLAEQEKLRREIEAEKVQAENKLRYELKSVEQALLQKLSKMDEKIHQKKLLLKKVKQTLLYKPSSGKGEEKSNVAAKKLPIGYCWPLDLYSGPQFETSQVFELTENLLILMEEFPCTYLWKSLGTFWLETNQSNKRKLHDFEPVVSKRLKMSEPVLMIEYCWPLVLYNGKKSLTLTINLPISTQMPQGLPVMQKQTMNRIKRKFSDDDFPLSSKRVKTETKPLMISYAWPLAIYRPRKMIIEPRFELSYPFPLPINKLPKFESECWQPVCVSPLLMLTYQDQPHQNDFPSPLTDLLIQTTHDDQKGNKRKSSECEELEPDSKRFKSFADIPCYKYKIIGKMTKTNKCLQSPGLCSPKKVTKRRYQAPLFKKKTSHGRKRSFLDFLEDLSSEEMQDVQVDEGTETVLDSPVIVVKPRSKKPRFTASSLLEMSSSLSSSRRMSSKLLLEEEFMSCEEISKKVADNIIHALLVKIC